MGRRIDPDRPHLLQINYRSGQSVQVEVKKFTVSTNKMGLKEVEWENIRPNPLMFNLNEVESIWELP